jgi:minor extracellular serine protease Vpr
LRRACAAALTAVAVLAAGCGDEPSPTRGESVAFDARSPRVPPGSRIRVLVELRRPSLGDRMGGERLDAGAQRAYVASLESEANALLSALRAKDVETGRPVLYTRAWAGFAVTLDPRDLPAVQALGLRAEPVRWFYGALAGSGAPAGGGSTAAAPVPRRAAARGDGPALALLDSGVARRLPELRGRVVPGFDAVDHDGDPSPRSRLEQHGTAVAGVLAAALPRGERFLAVRVAGRQGVEGAPEVEAAASDQLLTGLERTVDPDHDGSVDDHIPIALVGVSSPYSGFAGAPEAEAVRAAARIGTLVVAPAGNEGPAGGAFGTIGSPAAAPEALAVGALDGRPPEDAPGVPTVELGLATGEGRAKLNGALLGGTGRALRAPVTTLAGRSQAEPRRAGRATGADPLEYLDVEAAPKTRGKVVVVPAADNAGERPSLAQRATAASAAGAAALVVCEPDAGRPLRPLPVGAAAGIPVVGLSGDDARRALELTVEKAGGVAFLSRPRDRRAEGGRRVAGASSRGPTYSLAPKPDLVAPGTARTFTPTGSRIFAGGTSIAAARAAGAVLEAHRRSPDLDAHQLAAALIGTAQPAGPLLAAGAGRPDPAAAATAPVLASPPAATFRSQDRGRVRVRLENPHSTPVVLRLSATGLAVEGFPRQLRIAAGGSARLTLRLTGRPARRSGFATGRLVARAGARQVAVALLAALARPPAPKLGAVRAVTRRGQISGVRFTAGSVQRSGDAIAVEPVGSLRLELVDARGKAVRELTPPGGAADILPGEYSYTLPGETGSGLGHGSYRFRVTVQGVAGGAATAESQPFQIR